jgi:hypothetical protein
MAQTNTSGDKHAATRYRVRVRTHLDSSWLSEFPVVRLAAGYDSHRQPVTTMIVSVRDQAELMGMLMELHGMGLSVLSMQVLPVSHRRVAHTASATGKL